MPALTRAQLAKDPERMYQPLFAQAQPQRQRQRKVKKLAQDTNLLQHDMMQPSQGFNPTYSQMMQPLLMEPYTPQHDHQHDSASHATFSFQTSPTHGRI